MPLTRCDTPSPDLSASPATRARTPLRTIRASPLLLLALVLAHCHGATSCAAPRGAARRAIVARLAQPPPPPPPVVAPPEPTTPPPPTPVAQPLGTPLRVTRTHVTLSPRIRARLDLVAHPEPAARAALEQPLREWLGHTAEDFADNIAIDLGCTATVALTTLVSYLCLGTSETRPAEYAPGRAENFPRSAFTTFTWAIDGAALRAVSSDEFFSDDAPDVVDAACRREAEHLPMNPDECRGLDESAIAIGSHGLLVAFRVASSFTLPQRSALTWRTLGNAVRRDGPLARVPHALDHADAPCALSR